MKEIICTVVLSLGLVGSVWLHERNANLRVELSASTKSNHRYSVLPSSANSSDLNVFDSESGIAYLMYSADSYITKVNLITAKVEAIAYDYKVGEDVLRKIRQRQVAESTSPEAQIEQKRRAVQSTLLDQIQREATKISKSE